jgi:hypothetical protein
MSFGSGFQIYQGDKIALILLFIWALIIRSDYLATIQAERENLRQHYNSQKISQFIWRIWLIVLTFQTVFVIALDIKWNHFDFYDLYSLGYPMLAIAAYLRAINWIKPPPKTVQVKIPEGAVFT